ncbi:transcriptional regulator [Luteimicrobium album]|uniref:Transcriptional regulator n=1 Tax=Luteimicrobium album TaxID=1054550 RepID=A0ABQ6HYW3_9MICO|nr:ROK family transcriptional regulator [Luteimicrobium album]GMA23646.1 transcriptional regulator [Luteimicrobium album]
MAATPQQTTHSSPRERTREDLYWLIRTSEEVTRSALVEVTGLSRSTVNHAVSRLIADGLIQETEPSAKGPGSGSGRPATRLSAVAAGAHVAGIDFGHNHIYVAVADGLGRTVGEERIELDVDLQASEAMDTAADLLARLRRAHGIDGLGSVVAGIPGPLDAATGLVQSPTILSSWVGLAPADELGARLGTRVHVENDAVLGAYGELTRGVGRHYANYLYVKASHGIGASLVIGGAPYRGATGIAGEIGHTHLPGQTQMCRCGNRGCLEAVVSVDSIREQIAHTHPALDPATLTLATVHDSITDRILNEAGRTLGGVLADLCNLLNPGAVVVGGELGDAGRALIEGVQASITRHAQPATAAVLEVVPAELSTSAELVGALQLAASAVPR